MKQWKAVLAKIIKAIKKNKTGMNQQIHKDDELSLIFTAAELMSYPIKNLYLSACFEHLLRFGIPVHREVNTPANFAGV